jgi:AraC-like DNA-binding protein
MSDSMPEPCSRSAVSLPTPALRPFVSHYAGFCARDLTPGTHAGLPSRHVHLIISLGAPVEILRMPNSNQRSGRFSAFVSGLQEAPALVRRGGSIELLHVFLEPVALRPLLSVPGAELASRVFALSDLWGQRRSDGLVEQLSDAPSWQRRFDILDDIFTRTLTPVERPARLLSAWQDLAANCQMPIDELARRSGWSRQHLTTVFRREFGVTPGTARRIFRFEQACRLIKSARPRLAEVAAACGYHDQARMTHEWNALAGCAPRTWIANELPFLQDYELAGCDDDAARSTSVTSTSTDS